MIFNKANIFSFYFIFLDVVPSEQIIDIGRQARLECLTEDRDRSAVTWMKDGQPLPNHPRIIANRQTLQIFNLQREDYGMYQCFVARGNQEAQASSELRLGGKFRIRCHTYRTVSCIIHTIALTFRLDCLLIFVNFEPFFRCQPIVREAFFGRVYRKKCRGRCTVNYNL